MSNLVYVVVDYIGFYILGVFIKKEDAENRVKAYKEEKKKDALIKEMKLS